VREGMYTCSAASFASRSRSPSVTPKSFFVVTSRALRSSVTALSPQGRKSMCALGFRGNIDASAQRLRIIT
jgi:hypothetical protein